MAEDKKTKKDLEKLIVKASDWKEDNSDYISTGILPLDIILTRGGYRKGRLVETFGEEHSGKTLMSMIAIIWDQKTTGRRSLFNDVEGSFDIRWFKKLGGNMDLLDVYDPYRFKPIYGEQTYDNILDLIDTGKYSFAVLDSLMGSALLPKKILDKDLDETEKMAANATLNQSFIRRAFLKTSTTGTVLIITNHLKHKIGVLFGNNETTSGGDDLKFRAEQRLRMSRPSDKSDEGHTSKIKIIKNKRGGTAGQTIDFYFDYTKGVDNFYEMTKLLIKEGIIEKKRGSDYGNDDFYNSINGNFNEYEKYRSILLDKKREELVGITKDEVDDFEEENNNDFEEKK